MTPTEARDYFFQNLSNVRTNNDLRRLTYWVLPHLEPLAHKPLTDIHRMKLEVGLQYQADGGVNVEWRCDRNIAGQLQALAPLYDLGKFKAKSCQGETQNVKLDNGPSFRSRGMPLGFFAAEHAAAEKALNKAKTVQQWWKTFMAHTPLWLRTAYNWEVPTAKQQKVLDEAKTAMLLHVPNLVRKTEVQYSQGQSVAASILGLDSESKDEALGNVTLGVGWVFPEEWLYYVPYWNAIGAGQCFVDIEQHTFQMKDYVDFGEFGRAAPCVVQSIRDVCSVACSVENIPHMGTTQIKRAMLAAKRSAKAETMTLPDLDEGLSV